MPQNSRGGLIAGLLLLSLSSGCASSIHKDDITANGQTEVFGVVDPATTDHVDNAETIRLENWTQYTAFPQKIVTNPRWQLFFVVCCDSSPPKISRNWRDVAYFLANRSGRTALQNLYVYAHQEELGYFLERGDTLSSLYVNLAVFRPSGSGGLVRLNRTQYRQAHIPNSWARFLRFIGWDEGDPTVTAFEDLPAQWLPAAPATTPTPPSS